MSSKELLAVLCLLEKMSDTAKMECLTFLRLLRENEEMKLLAASSHQTSQPEAKWYTPFYFRDIWHYRRIWAQMDLLLQTDEKPAEQVTGKLKSSAALPPLPLQETKTGQLTLF